MGLRNLSRILFRILVCTLVLVVLSACSEVPVAEDLTQEQAREVIAALERAGIPARFARTQKGGKTYHVSVSSDLANQAAARLHEQGVPDRSRDRFLSALSTNSILPDSHLVEALRLDHARALQLENLILQLPNVSGAYAVLRLFSVRHSLRLGEKLPVQEPAVGGVPSSGQGVSIVVRLRAPDEHIVDEIKRLVVSVLPELRQDAISIVVSHEPTEEQVSTSTPIKSHITYEKFLFGWRVASEDYFELAVAFLVIIILCLLTGGCIGYWVAVLVLHGGAGESRFRSHVYGTSLSKSGEQPPFDAYQRSEGGDMKGRV